MEQENMKNLVVLLNKWDDVGEYIFAEETGKTPTGWIVRVDYKRLLTPRSAAMMLLSIIASAPVLLDEFQTDLKMVECWLFGCDVSDRMAAEKEAKNG